MEDVWTVLKEWSLIKEELKAREEYE